MNNDIQKIQLETYQKKLPSAGSMVEIRPALVKEEKIWLIGKESEETSEFLDGLIRVVENCVIKPTNFNVSKMSYNDMIWSFLEIMKISKGESIYLNVPCQNDKCLDSDGEPYIDKGVLFKLSEIEKIENLNVNKDKIVRLTPTRGLELQYPTVDYMRSLSSKDNKDIVKNRTIAEMELIQSHIVAFLEGDTRYDFKTPKEAIEWTDNNLSKKDIVKIKEWFVNEPKPYFELEWKCTKCLNDNKLVERDLLRFLDL
jgi:hypothetical protein